MQIDGKTILLTGGTDGIGKALAAMLKAGGATVIVTGRTAERVAAAEAAGFEAIAVDLSSAAGVASLVAAVAGRTIDVLINNAGVGSDHDFRESAPIDSDDNDRSVYLNLNAPMRLIAALMPGLRARPAAMIVNVTSGLAIAPNAGSPVYCATKAGLRSYTQALRSQLGATNIHVMEVLPPVVETKMTAALTGSKLPVAACAQQIMQGIMRDATEVNVGQVRMLQVVNSISPALARRIMLRF